MPIADIKQKFANMTARQKAITGIFIIVAIVILWQIINLFGGGSKVPSSSIPITTKGKPGAMQNTATMTPPANPKQMQPKAAELQKQTVMSQRESEIIKAQQESQAKYLSSLNNLQMLKVERELAETNQAIASAKLATITAEKNIVDLLAPPAPPKVTTETYAKGLVNPTKVGEEPTANGGLPSPISATQHPQVNYTVISVSQLQYRWNAVIGYQGNLFNVSVGDVLPTDSSKVVAIDRSGVTLEKDGLKKKISLVPII